MKYKVTLNGISYEVEVTEGETVLLDEYEAASPSPAVSAAATAAPLPQSSPAPSPSQPAPAVASGEVITAPIPGVVLKVNVQPGMKVKKGEVLLILEAMKMENEILAPRDAAVSQVLAAKGANVDTGAPLVVLS